MGIAQEYLRLDFVDVVLQSSNDRRIAIDYGIQNGVQNCLRAPAQELGIALHPSPHQGQVGSLAVPDCDHEVAADEDVQLSEVHLLDVIEVARRSKDHEQRVAVPLQLGSLMRDDGVLDG